MARPFRSCEGLLKKGFKKISKNMSKKNQKIGTARHGPFLARPVLARPSTARHGATLKMATASHGWQWQIVCGQMVSKAVMQPRTDAVKVKAEDMFGKPKRWLAKPKRWLEGRPFAHIATLTKWKLPGGQAPPGRKNRDQEKI